MTTLYKLSAVCVYYDIFKNCKSFPVNVKFKRK